MFRSLCISSKAVTLASVPLSKSFRLVSPFSTLPGSSFSQLLTLERIDAEHTFSQIVSKLKLDPVTNKWVCDLKVTDFRATELDGEGKGPKNQEKEVKVRGEGETSLDATNNAARKALDAFSAQDHEDDTAPLKAVEGLKD